MPFDVGIAPKRTVEQQQNLVALISVLESPMTNWDWNYNYYSNATTAPECGTAGCAIGYLAREQGWKAKDIFGTDDPSVAEAGVVTDHLGLTGEQCWAIFGAAHRTFFPDDIEGRMKVTPSQVAQLLREHL